MLRPEGEIRFLEHVVDPEPGWRRRLQRGADPLWSRLAGGCHQGRDTVAALEAAGIPDFRFHDNRHTALSRMTRVKGLKAAQRLAGHASIASTARYAHCEHDELREAMERVEATHTGPTIVETGKNPAEAKPLGTRRKVQK